MSEINLILALQQVENLSKLTEKNEYAEFIASHLFPIKIELERQLTNFRHHSKIKE